MALCEHLPNWLAQPVADHRPIPPIYLAQERAHSGEGDALGLNSDRVAVRIGRLRHRIGVDLKYDLTTSKLSVIGPPPFHASDVKGAANGFRHLVGDDRSLLLELPRL